MNCGYCQVLIEDDNYLGCQDCSRSVHIKCLKQATPGDLLGDVFFDFTCINCASEERYARQRIPWLLVLTLTLYNLSIKQKGLGHHGYFHWRTHIISFVGKHWNYIFGSHVRRRKQWSGSVSGALSHNSPEYFQSGLDLFQEHGWWKLSKRYQTPRSVLREYEKKQLQRQQLRNDKRVSAVDENSCSSELSVTDNQHVASDEKPTDENITASNEGCARAIPYMGCGPKLANAASAVPAQLPASNTNQQELPLSDSVEEAPQQSLSTVQASLMDFLAESLGGDDLSMFNSLHGIMPMPTPLIGAGKSDFFMADALLEAPTETGGLFELETNFGIPAADINDDVAEDQSQQSSAGSELEQIEKENIDIKKEEGTSIYQPRIVQITNFQAQEPSIHIKAEPMEQELDETDEIETQKSSIEACKPSGFAQQPRRNWPWLQETYEICEDHDDDIHQSIPCENLTLMSVFEEQNLHQRLQKILAVDQQSHLHIPSFVRRLYRKLCLRKWKREHNCPIFNLDEHVDPTLAQRQKQSQILDRYQLLTHSRQDARSSFYARLAGSDQYELFKSPYSQRILHPFIFRSENIAPPWLRLMCEMQHRITGCHPTRGTIDLCYVRPQHIPAVNALLQSVFWPGIDVSDCLSYPDYSVVALYKKLVIGCGFLVPDVGYNEAYISFMAVRPNWQRSGIATLMLYHLVQTCMSKDITLHVSANNSAVMLYQKFGFKIEEIILDFYDKYLPHDSKQSRNAFFLRLMR
ncbi:LOW QUALITY PROTEIN: cysteine-rich protein 2-binding protein [Drosophila tropicalis]|uniref:LOW QUALITY PROTEIN: cysteine-rich protein 2-binding protein n=1 Tax=Drosophila tropicalis TaxID=46794 RepID=UPI0035AB911B